jgi:asparaginyl-tRNA synthetase
MLGMEFTIKECLGATSALDKLVIVHGWVKTRRDSKAGFSFINLSDGSCQASLQLVVPNTLVNYHSDVLKITSGCSIEAEGILVASPKDQQACELQVSKIRVFGFIDNPDTYPISPKKHSLEYLREVAHLRPRTNIIGAVARVRNAVSQAIHRFFHDRGFLWVHTPLITASDCEGAGELFRVSLLDSLKPPLKADGAVDFSQDFFGRETFLTVSGQLNVEAYCLALSKVYTFGPTFRAENSNTSRHLAEFWMVEPEIAFAGLPEICNLSQDLLRYVCQVVLQEHLDDMEFFDTLNSGVLERIQQMSHASFDVLSYTDAIEILEQITDKFQYKVSWGVDLQSEHERFLAEEYFKKPVILTDYPAEIKSFYMRLNDDGKTVAAMDVLAPGIGEIIGGSQREERADVLDARMQHLGLNLETYSWYRDLRRYGTVPHAGFGLGLDRLVSYVTGVTNLRDVIPFPRTPGNAIY